MILWREKNVGKKSSIIEVSKEFGVNFVHNRGR
jgi:hypothetical protein